MEIVKVQKINSLGRKTNKTIIKIICDFCEKPFDYTSGLAHYKRTRHHYCSRACQANGNNLIKGNDLHGMAIKRDTKNKRYSVWCGAKKRALRKGIDFDIKPNDIPKIPKTCPMLGISINADLHKLSDNSPSLDRIDSTRGYLIDNIQIISNRANRIKSDATIEELEKIVAYLKNI